MTSTGRRLLPALALVAAIAVAGSAPAAESEVVATAPTAGAPPNAPDVAPAAAAATGAAPSVAEQIDSYLKTSPAARLPADGAAGVTPGDEPRKVHGMVDVSAGTGGYRSAYVRTDIPVGQNGTASIAFGETHFGNQFGGRYGGQFAPGARQSFGLGLRFDDAALDPSSLRCRQAAGEDGLGVRRDPRIDGDRPGACSGAGMPAYPQ
jgi:hypothetical protein